MSKNDEIFYKIVSEVIPALVALSSEEYEKNKRIALAEIADKSIHVKNFILAVFELTDERRKAVQYEG